MESHGDFQSLGSGGAPPQLLCGYLPVLPFPFWCSTIQSALQPKPYALQLIIFQYRLPESGVTQQEATELSLSKCKINKHYTWQAFYSTPTGLSSASGLAHIFAPASSTYGNEDLAQHHFAKSSIAKLHHINLLDSICRYANGHLLEQQLQHDSIISQIFSGQKK